MEQIKFSTQIDLIPKGDSLYKIGPLKSDCTININTAFCRAGDSIIIFTSNIGGIKKIHFDIGCDIMDFPVDRSGFLQIMFDGTNFVERLAGNTRGEKGEVGPRGEKGEKGDSIVGPKGDSIVGPRGEAGPRGEKGEVGPSGEKGEKGDSIVGPKGEKGEPGMDGRNGRDGRSCTCEYCMGER